VPLEICFWRNLTVKSGRIHFAISGQQSADRPFAVNRRLEPKRFLDCLDGRRAVLFAHPFDNALSYFPELGATRKIQATRKSCERVYIVRLEPFGTGHAASGTLSHIARGGGSEYCLCQRVWDNHLQTRLSECGSSGLPPIWTTRFRLSALRGADDR
jgi:hypothetical protein